MSSIVAKFEVETAGGGAPGGLRARLARWRAGGVPGRGRFAVDGVSDQLPLAHGTLHRVRLLAGGTLQAISGSLWITFDDEPADHVVEPGETLHLAPGKSAIAYALEDAVLRVRPAATAAR